MEVKGYIYLPKDEINDPQTVIAWVTNAYEQGGYFTSLGEAKADRKNYNDEWVLVPISFVTGEPLED